MRHRTRIRREIALRLTTRSAYARSLRAGPCKLPFFSLHSPVLGTFQKLSVSFFSVFIALFLLGFGSGFLFLFFSFFCVGYLFIVQIHELYFPNSCLFQICDFSQFVNFSKSMNFFKFPKKSDSRLFFQMCELSQIHVHFSNSHKKLNI